MFKVPKERWLNVTEKEMDHEEKSLTLQRLQSYA